MAYEGFLGTTLVNFLRWTSAGLGIISFILLIYGVFNEKSIPFVLILYVLTILFVLGHFILS